ncbi:MAG: TIGR00730 family Rossman fold protein [Planctomycetes bacterium]|nr:TIGR00730 family Rossman fold protein [Planctomycetota bacterium]
MTRISPSRIAVYCGSRSGAQPAYLDAARQLGAEMANRGYGLVYGGGGIGLMGEVANAVMAGGGDVLGVIPDFLETDEVAHHGLTHLEVVSDMPARKRRMIEEAGAFVALPGGTGTLEELFEVLSWRQLDLHAKPIVALDVGGFWQPLVSLLDHVCSEGFTSPPQRELLQVASDVDELFRFLEGS